MASFTSRRSTGAAGALAADELHGPIVDFVLHRRDHFPDKVRNVGRFGFQSNSGVSRRPISTVSSMSSFRWRPSSSAILRSSCLLSDG